MIDLDAAATDLSDALDHVHPDVAQVRARAQRRQRARRIAAGTAAVVLLVAGAAAASTIVGDQDDRDGVVTGPGPDGPRDTDGSDPVPAGWQAIDLGDLRVLAPVDWKVLPAETDARGCGGPDTIVIGDPPAEGACPEPTALRVAFLQEPLDGTGDDPQTRNGIALVRLADDPTPVWAAPDLGVRLSFGEGVDAGSILSTIGPSARKVALDDVAGGAEPLWRTDPEAWRAVTYDGVAIEVPAAWPDATGAEFRSQIDPCLEWVLSGPSAIRGKSAIPCRSSDSWRPRDGAWLLPLAGTEAEAVSAAETIEVGDLEVRVLTGASGTVLEVYPVDAEPGVLVRIGLGEDGHVAGSILSSIRLVEDAAVGPDAIALPCGPVAIPDRSMLDLPADLDAEPTEGLGGWPEGQPEGTCAVHVIDTEDPGRHVSFLDGDLPYAIAPLGNEPGSRMVTWGEIEDGFGGWYTTADGDMVSVLAYGITRAEAAALFASIAST
jgi:hypothetical protein